MSDFLATKMRGGWREREDIQKGIASISKTDTSINSSSLPGNLIGSKHEKIKIQ